MHSRGEIQVAGVRCGYQGLDTGSRSGIQVGSRGGIWVAGVKYK
jgi:hypothetical protein